MKAITQFATDDDCRRRLFPGADRLLIVILAKAFDYAKKGLNAVFAHIPAASDLSVGAATALSRVALVCVLAGLVAHTVTAHRLIDALESSVLSKIPAYDYLKQESASALGVAEIANTPLSSCPWKGDGSSAFKPKR